MSLQLRTLRVCFVVVCFYVWLVAYSPKDRLVGLVVQVSASRAEGPGFDSCFLRVDRVVE